MAFPKDFLWGVATASYQIEGGGLSEGRGECIWHRFSHTSGKVVNGDTGDVACDHLHRYKEDVALMRELGVQGYRFSTSWARVIPLGTGQINEQGVDFYDRLVDELLRAGIEPWVTLYHWDLPQALQDKGGWANPDSPTWFAEYTDLMTRTLGDRVKGWITLNEPWCISFLSYFIGEHAPGLRDLPTALKAAHYLNLAHGESMRIIRRNCPGVPAGITLNLYPAYPLTDSAEDAEAARRFDGFQNRWFLDPVFRGEYPADMLAFFGAGMDGIDVNALKSAAEPMDLLGVNFYSRALVRHNPDAPGGFELVQPEGSDYTQMGWEIYPQGLTDILTRVHRDYAPKALYVTENGAAFEDPTPVNGVVEDPQRAAYLDAHFRAAEQAIEQGVPLKGYFVWSFMDNFEWAFGYTRRFGIVHVDYATQKRTPKRSALLFRDVASRVKV